MPNKKIGDNRDQADAFNAEQGLIWVAEEMLIFKDDPKMQEKIMENLQSLTYLIVDVNNE